MEKPEDAPNVLREKYQNHLCQIFLLVNVIFILFGFVQIAIVVLVGELDSDVLIFMRTFTDYNEDHKLLIFASASTIIFAGFCAILYMLGHCSITFDSYHCFLYIALALRVMAAITPGLISTRPDQTEFESLFKAEIFHQSYEVHREGIWGHEIWNNLEKNLQCCGVNDFRDWLFSQVKSIPISCCLKDHLADCELRLAAQTTQISINTSLPNFKLLAQVGCLESLQNEIKEIKQTWIEYALIFTTIDILLMPWAIYFARMMRMVSDTIQDIATLHELQYQLNSFVQPSDSESDSDTRSGCSEDAKNDWLEGP